LLAGDSEAYFRARMGLVAFLKGENAPKTQKAAVTWSFRRSNLS
jgi:hypothetical protein